MTAPPLAPPKRRGRRAHQPTTAERPAGPCRVCVYIRRSTDDEHQPYTIEAQTQKLQAYVDSQPGWTIAATFTDDASGAGGCAWTAGAGRMSLEASTSSMSRGIST